MGGNNFIKSFSIITEKTQPFPFNILAVRHAGEIDINNAVNIFIGDNGCGKSTLLETLALKINLPLISGHISNKNSFEAAHLLLPYLDIDWINNTQKGFFFRAEDFSHFIYQVESKRTSVNSFLAQLGGELNETVLKSMGEGMNNQLQKMRKDYGEDMNAFSHGEAYLKILETRINGKGIYILDEPEAALSPSKQLALISLIMDMTKNYKSQFIIATHSPIIMGFPGALLYEIKEEGFNKTDFRDTEHYTITRSFLENPDQFLRYL